MKKLETLNALTHPLNKISLIEASAGTGKTFTMSNLYLRLLLGVNCQPLTVEQILVVTFTRAATQELRDRIRLLVKETSEYFVACHKIGKVVPHKNTFLLEIYPLIENNLDEALLRLRIAEQDIDIASIFTIDSFCQKMLSSFAFDSGMRFDIELQPDETELLERLSQEVWRELFYSSNKTEAEFIFNHLTTPKNAYNQIKSLLNSSIELTDRQQCCGDLDKFLKQYNKFITEFKQFWLDNFATLKTTIEAELNKKYKKGEKKALYRPSYKKNDVAGRFNKLNDWANSNNPSLPNVFSYFCQNTINEITLEKEEGEPLQHLLFVENNQYLARYEELDSQLKQYSVTLKLKFLFALQQKIKHYKASHKERNFSDFTNELNIALQSEKGQNLVNQIRQCYPFAMIDEFQDTNLAQYQVFNEIFIRNNKDQGFIMIGDPKQSIYKFRGADIFTYLKASQQSDIQATLNKNWRSLPSIVTETNHLFDFNNEVSPFIYQDIQFQPVEFDIKNIILSEQENIRYFIINSELIEENKQGKEALNTTLTRISAEHCAAQIQQQLKLAEEGKLFITKGEISQTIEAQDIAILVRNGDQAELIQQALKTKGIQSVYLSQKNSVYTSDEALQILYLLKACLHPNSQKNILASLGTSLWLLNSLEIFELKNDEEQWDNWLEKFSYYNEIWLKQGILPMLHHIFITENILSKLASTENGERKITNLLHLAELLQSAMPKLENETALVHWYETQLDNPLEHQEEQVLRLETEQKLIKIITFHGSKGLQYPIVWLPFIGNTTTLKMESGITQYRDEKNQSQWCLNEQTDEVKNAIAKENFAEELRLLYVAITRAEYQLNFILPEIFEFKNNWNAMAYLLSNGKIGDKPYTDTLITTRELLEKKQLKGKIVNLTKAPTACDWTPSIEIPQNLQAKIFNRHIHYDGRVTSFSALHNYHQYKDDKNTEFVLQDYDYQIKNTEIAEQEHPNLYSPFYFPHSIKVGTILHSFFEHYDFTKPLEIEKIQQLCEQLNLDQEWIEPTKKWFENILNTPFTDQNICLKEIKNNHRLNELQFYLRLNNTNALIELNKLIKKYAKLNKLPALSLPQLNGFVRGFIDCIIKVNNKFYLIDYKSNFLGYFDENYSNENLEKVMGQYRYDLQYLLYTLAVHRYLKSRLKDYDYERDFGGIAYLFLRAMNEKPQNGIFFDKPNKELIENMDTLFD